MDAVRACSYRIGVSRHRARNSSSSDLVITEIDFRPRRSDNLFVGGIAAPTCAVATRNEVLTTAKALETGAASGRIRFLRLLTRRLSLAEDPLQRTIFLAPMKRFLSGENN